MGAIICRDGWMDTVRMARVTGIGSKGCECVKEEKYGDWTEKIVKWQWRRE